MSASLMQALQLQSNADATNMIQTDRALAKHAIADHGLSPGEQVCVAATEGGGFTRSTAFSHAMRQAWEQSSVASGLNTLGTAGQTAAAGSDQKRYQDWQDIFCDPMGNSVSFVPCGNSIQLNPPLFNADVEPVKYLFNNLTIPVDDPGRREPQIEAAVNDIINNMVGLPVMDAVTPGALSTPTGSRRLPDAPFLSGALCGHPFGAGHGGGMADARQPDGSVGRGLAGERRTCRRLHL